jgi:hypothetical protein
MGFKTFEEDHPGFFASMDRDKLRFYRRVCMVPKGARLPGCPCVGDLRVREFDGFFHLRDLYNHLEASGTAPVTISFDEIWYNSHYPGNREAEIEKNDARFQKADSSFPGILAPLRNPDNKPYRMLDGRRRLWKQQEEGALEGQFFVVPEETVFDFFWMLLSLDAVKEHMDKD